VRGRTLFIIGIVLLVLWLALRQREAYPSSDDVLVMNDCGWICIQREGIKP
jgi:hypothetical protein